MPETDTTQTTTPRSLPVIQAEFALEMRHLRNFEEKRKAKHPKAFSAFDEAERKFKAAKKALELLLAEEPLTQDIGASLKRIDDLKEEARAAYEPLLGSTFRDKDGAGFQFRATTKTVIQNEETLAKALLEQHLWQDIGATLTVSPARAAQVLKTHSLPGLSVEPSITVAAYGPSQEN